MPDVLKCSMDNKGQYSSSVFSVAVSQILLQHFCVQSFCRNRQLPSCESSHLFSPIVYFQEGLNRFNSGVCRSSIRRESNFVNPSRLLTLHSLEVLLRPSSSHYAQKSRFERFMCFSYSCCKFLKSNQSPFLLFL